MFCCVIGGGGFIGRRLVHELIGTGREILVVGRQKEPPKGFPARAKYVFGDYGDRAFLKRILVQCDEVINLAYATVPQTSYVDPMFDLQANLPPSVGLLEIARDIQTLRSILIVSSGGTVYGQSERLPISEDAQTTPVSPYGITKLTIERYGLMFHKLHGIPVKIARPSNAYGSGQKPFIGQGFIATAIGHIYRGNEVLIFGEKGTIRDYIHVRDVSSGIVAILDQGKVGEVYNIGSGIGRDNRSVLDLIESFARIDGYLVRVRIEPARNFDVPANVLNYGKLLACSGWMPKVSFESGIAEMWQEGFLKQP